MSCELMLNEDFLWGQAVDTQRTVLTVFVIFLLMWQKRSAKIQNSMQTDPIDLNIGCVWHRLKTKKKILIS